MKTKRLLQSAIFSMLFIGVTAFFGWANGSNQFCFIFHLIPFGLAFSGGSVFMIIIYYIALFLLIGLIIFGIIKPSKEPTKDKQ